MAKLIIPGKVISRVVGTAVPKPEDDQSTEDMVYGGKLNKLSFKEYGRELFKDEREKDPNHPLNDPRFKGATILIGGDNYGAGSSREHAPQGHKYAGFKALVTAGFAGIFQGNCGSIGLVAVTVPKSNILTLVDVVKEMPQTRFGIDLESKKITYEFAGERQELSFDMPEATRQSLLEGTWDALAILRSYYKEVEAKMRELPHFE